MNDKNAAHSPYETSVADPGCLSRIPDSDFTHPGPRIPDPGSNNCCKREGWKNLFLSDIFLEPKISQNVKLLYFWNTQEKNLGQISKNYCFFLPQKLSLCSQKYEFGIRDPRSGIRNKPIPDPGSRGIKKAPDPGSGSATLYEIIRTRHFAKRANFLSLCHLCRICSTKHSGEVVGALRSSEVYRTR